MPGRLAETYGISRHLKPTGGFVQIDPRPLLWPILIGMGTTVDIWHAGWMINDGEPMPRPGEPWVAMVEVQRDGPATDSDWHPHVKAARVEDHGELEVLPSRSATYRFAGRALIIAGGWTILDCRGVRIAVPGSFPDGATGTGRFVHDTYFVAPHVREALRTQLLVEDVRREGESFTVTGWPQTP